MNHKCIDQLLYYKLDILNEIYVSTRVFVNRA